MIRLHFVVDGPRDYRVIPKLVEHLLDAAVAPTCAAWARLHAPRAAGRRRIRGLHQKLLYAIRQARDQGATGLVATVDRDKTPKPRLKTLKAARDHERAHHPTFPAALGEANPHAEAWLLDDPVAVREALNLARDTEIPPVTRTKSPKNALDDLIANSPPSPGDHLDVLADIAEQLDATRCAHTRKTGFHAFAEEVRTELGPLARHDKST